MQLIKVMKNGKHEDHKSITFYKGNQGNLKGTNQVVGPGYFDVSSQASGKCSCLRVSSAAIASPVVE